MKKNIQLSLIAALILTACGGDGEADRKSATPPTVTPPTTVTPPVTEPTPIPAVTITGKVIDGYLEGATTYLDLNFNRRLDDGEPSAVTSSTGEYRLDLTEAEQECAQYVPLVVDVPVGAVDIDSGLVVDKAYQMVRPPRFKPVMQGDFYHITPLTSVIWNRVEIEVASGGPLTCQSMMADQFKRQKLMRLLIGAANNVASFNSIPMKNLYKDYIAEDYSATAVFAKGLVPVLQKSFSAREELKGLHPDASNVYVDYRFEYYQWYREQGVYWPNKSSTMLDVVSSDLSEVLRNMNHSKSTSVTDNEYTYVTKYLHSKYDQSDDRCEIHETIATTKDSKEYKLINSAYLIAPESECFAADLNKALKYRHASVAYSEAGTFYNANFNYSDDNDSGFPFLSDWVAMAQNQLNPDPLELVNALERLPYNDFGKTPTPVVPDADYWFKSQIVIDSDNVVTETRYDASGTYFRDTMRDDERTKHEISEDGGKTWGASS